MNFTFPEILLPSGRFTYIETSEKKEPVFIDTNGTAHFDKGQVIQFVFTLGMQSQWHLENSVFDEGMEYQKHLDHNEIHQLNEKIAELKSKLKEARGKEKLASEQPGLEHEEVEKLPFNQKELKNRIAELSEQADLSAKLEIVNGLVNTSLPSSVNKPQPFSGQEPDKTEKLSDDHGAGLGDFVEIEENKKESAPSSENEKVEIVESAPNLFNPNNLSLEDRIKFICDELKKNPNYRFPVWFKEELNKCLSNLCNDYKNGLPNLLDFLEAFYKLPKEVKLKQFFQLKMNNRLKNIPSAINTVLADRNNYSSFELLLAALPKHSTNKALKKAIYDYLERLYPSIESCMKNGLIDLATFKVQKIVKEFQKGESAEEVISSLNTLSGRPQSTYISRDLVIELLNKDVNLFSKLDSVFKNIKDKYKNDKRNISDFLKKLLNTGVERGLLIEEFGLDLAECCQHSPMPRELLSVELIEFWVRNRQNDVCKDALWICLASCPMENKELLSTYEDVFNNFKFFDLIIKDIPEKQPVLTYINLCQLWSENKVLPIESQLSIIWNEVKLDAKPEERKAFMEALHQGVLKCGDIDQFVAYLGYLKQELSENGKQWDVSPSFLSDLLGHINKMSLGKQPVNRNLLADFAKHFWGLQSYQHPDPEQIFAENADIFLENYIECLEGTDFSKEIPEVRENYFKIGIEESLKRILSEVSKKATKSKGLKKTTKPKGSKKTTKSKGSKKATKLPENFWLEILDNVKEKIKDKPVNEINNANEKKLFYAQMTGYTRLMIIKKYLEDVGKSDSEHFLKIKEAAAYCFTDAENENSKDYEVNENFKEYFDLVFNPEQDISFLLEKVKDGLNKKLPQFFWKNLEKDMLQMQGTFSGKDPLLNAAHFIGDIRNILLERMIGKFPQITKDSLLEIKTVAENFYTDLKVEQKYETDLQIKQHNCTFWETLCRAAFERGNSSAWQYFSMNWLEKHLDTHIEPDEFTYDEWTNIAIRCMESSDKKMPSTLVQTIVRDCLMRRRDKKKLAGSLFNIAEAYSKNGKTDEFIYFLKDKKDYFTSEKMDPMQMDSIIQKLDKVKSADSEIRKVVIELEQHFQKNRSGQQ